MLPGDSFALRPTGRVRRRRKRDLPSVDPEQAARQFLRNLGRGRHEVRRIAKSFTIDNVAPMCPLLTSFRILTWCCVILLAVLSLLSAQGMVRTGVPGQLKHFVCCLSRIVEHRDFRVWTAGFYAIQWFTLDIRRRFGVPATFSAGRTSVSRGFCGIGTRRVLRRLGTALLVRRLWEPAYPEVVLI